MTTTEITLNITTFKAYKHFLLKNIKLPHFHNNYVILRKIIDGK